MQRDFIHEFDNSLFLLQIVGTTNSWNALSINFMMKFVILVLVINVFVAWSVCGDDAHDREKRSPDKYDDEYSKFLRRNFQDANEKHLDKKSEYKQAKEDYQSHEDDDDDGDDDEEVEHDDDDDDDSAGDGKADDDFGHDWHYGSSADYDRIKALSEKQVAELRKNPKNCKHYEKDGMVCATCEDPETGDNSESCAYSSEPHDKKVAYSSKKSHNYKKPQESEAQKIADDDDETEDKEEYAFNFPSGPKPVKHKSESEDADYGAYKLAGTNDDVEDYDEPKFANLKVAPKNQKLDNDFEIIPQSKFQSKNLNEALSHFKTKDWSKCNKIMKGDMTCYYCKDDKGATQEECMFISTTNPKNFKVERSESHAYDNTKKPNKDKQIKKSEALKITPSFSERKERFAGVRIGRPLAPTKATIKSTAEPLVTPKTNINPNTHNDSNNVSVKKSIKRATSTKKQVSEICSSYDDYGNVHTLTLGSKYHCEFSLENQIDYM
ncbi:CLUMA_CG010922, isoform A [Clunio marinus]|uniref:CLUMA_CG010922, isoform A n=1 Tax=Clunio marinus TaxID=568069 RepID=A0A1J1IEV8_9DIPT|nr:CLUMA_CG010922, isoform A [Clunio marinus]